MPIPMPPKKKEFSWGRFSKTLSFWILILLIPVILIQLTGAKSEASKPISYTDYRGIQNLAQIASPERKGFLHCTMGRADAGLHC